MIRARFGPAVAAACLAATIVVAAQQTPVFRTGVQYVAVDVVVTDGDDRPIRDLTKDDFEIVDRGRAQSITDFRFVNIPAAGTDLADLRAMPPASDVASNTGTSPDSRLFVMIVDTLHTLESEIIPMRQVITEFIRTISPMDEVAIIYPNRSDLGTNFTTDRQRMLKAMDDLRAAGGFAVDALGRTSSGLRGGRDAHLYGRALAFTFTQVANALAGSPHPRRAIIYAGAGSPLNVTDGDRADLVVRDEMLAAYRAAREANVPIYALDPRGMVQPADALRGGIGAIGGLGNASLGGVQGGLNNQKNNLYVAAINTGGRAFVDQSNTVKAMEAIVTENGSFYLLGFYPDPTPQFDRFNDIEVKVKRPGLKVRARAGYHAAARADTATLVDARLASAMTSALDVRGMALRAVAAPLLPTGNVMRTAVTMHVTYPTGVADDAPFDSIRYQILALDGDGKVKASTERSYAVRPPRSERESVALVINDVIDLPPQPLTLRVGVASRALGRAGTVQMPVDAPRPSESRIQMGGVVIGTPDSPQPPTLGADFIRAILPFQPTTRRTFTKRQTLRVFAPVFWRGRETVATVTITLEGTGVTLRREETLTVTQPVDGRRVTSIDTLVPLAQLSGEFTLTLEARVKDGQSAMRTVTFGVR
jgi:VWFA-related protein